MLTEIVEVQQNGITLSYCKAEDAEEYDIDTEKSLNELSQFWAKFSLKDSEGTLWVLGTNVTLRDLVTFLWGAVYASRVDFNLPQKVTQTHQCIVGWNYNGTDRYGEALTGQRVMSAYREAISPHFA